MLSYITQSSNAIQATNAALGTQAGLKIVTSALIWGLLSPVINPAQNLAAAQTPLVQKTITASTLGAPKPSRPNPSPLGEDETYSLGQIGASSLLFKTSKQGQYRKAPTIDTDVKINIAGPVIRTTLSQTFKNPSSDWVEGVYVFPLPENAAVDRLRIIVGGRFIICLLYTSPSPRDRTRSRMPSSA